MCITQLGFKLINFAESFGGLPYKKIASEGI